ncbi:hypothetical protein [Gilvimarinus sp. 1_MG-2023]|uniref:hypothetical protein n=1 Tax=Gilvimarinus sp. 1_MG-2023 TaxID=3062638 RepID=UPI0026E45325|nr:hypothetical protein [Gilvimarinus sp. 1_MG-2023]MDO6747333.1 hypothetical protein [Gilvimarinus sp. 1_MG-2023]
MHIPWLVLIIGLEAVLAVIILCLLLALHARKLKQLLARQQDQLRQAIQKPAQATPEPPPSPDTAPQAYLEAQLASTQAVFLSEAPESDIDAPQADALSTVARAAAIRHAILCLELDGDGSGLGSEHWTQIGELLAALSPTSSENGDGSEDLTQALENAQKRIENLEKFKKLFFEMESKWDAARDEAQGYHDQLSELSEGMENKDEFSAILARYNAVYDDISQTIEAASGNNISQTVRTESITLTKPDPRTNDQLNTLRNVAADQHRLINKLQKQLQDAESAEQKEVLINELQNQLSQQERYVKESETCVQLLESELDTALNKLNIYEAKAQDANHAQQEITEMRTTLQQYASEAKELVIHINMLETENQQLKGNTADPVYGDDAGLADQLETLKESYTTLEAQYAELEEKYLDLRMK